ncbi:MAG: hypothetical protein HUK00_04740 [Bacteroidaceae bacterium]|nr:hypothetical protein [Bacteroidaceae bacterium]
MKQILVVIMVLVAVGCGADHHEREAREMVINARIMFAAGEYKSACDTIRAMRTRYPRAIEARREALLLLDSIEMQAAIDSMSMSATEREADEHLMHIEFLQKRIQHNEEALKK